MKYREQGTGNREQFHTRSTDNAVILGEAQRSRRIRGCSSTAGSKKLLVLLGTCGLLFAAGCRQDMHNQPKMIPQRGSSFFADGRGARPQVTNTIARGQLDETSYYYTGVVQGPNGYREEKDQLPFPATMEVLRRGEERFNVYCTPCHSRVGNGLGEIVQRGYKPAANLHDQVRRAQPLSHYFYVMTHGYGAMPDYSAQLAPEDRWAVAAYIRALQLSQDAAMSDLPAGAQVQSLKELAPTDHQDWAQPWALPQTAVWSNQAPAQKEGTPAMAPANTADPVQMNTGKAAAGAKK
jgi:mono/diheme cytochrome c family protein